MQSDVDLVESYRRLTAAWLWVVGAALAGGLIGLLASYARSPLYEASAVVAIGIDRNRADVPDDITERQAFDRVRGLLLSDETLEAAVSLSDPHAEASALERRRAELRERIRLSERPDGWVLALTGEEPTETEHMAQAWADVAVEQLEVASEHALRAAEWQNVLFEASCRPMTDSAGSGAARWFCRSATPGGELDQVPQAILAEVEASRGILPVLTFSLLRGSAGTARAILWDRGALVLAGMILGMFVAGLVIAFRKPPLAAGPADGGAPA